MNRGAPMKRTPFARKAGPPATTANAPENALTKSVQRHAQQGYIAIINVVKKPVKTAFAPPPGPAAFRGSFPKSQPVRSEAYRRAVASLPCVICGIAGQSQAAHGSGAGTAVCKGMGIKSCDLTCAPFCVPHHQQLDQGAMFSKAVRHALEPVWAADTQRRIHAMGLWPKGIPYPHQQEQA